LGVKKKKMDQNKKIHFRGRGYVREKKKRIKGEKDI